VGILFRLADSYRSLFPIALNAPNLYRASLQPLEIIKALSDRNHGKHNSLFSSREHQDAQELFQLLSECIKTETAAVDTEGYRDRGLGGLAQLEVTSREIGKSVFDGLTANRRSCLECGYTEAVMHFAFDNWQLAVPRLVVRALPIILITPYLTTSCRAIGAWRNVSQTIRGSSF
jgi:ubiquitin carboxyl-terminal hydrolase 1